jgi:excisionase family DNA binding protein
MENEEADQLLTPDELAARLKMSLSTVYQKYREWGLTPYQVGRHLRFSDTEVTAWLAGQRRTA